MQMQNACRNNLDAWYAKFFIIVLYYGIIPNRHKLGTHVEEMDYLLQPRHPPFSPR